MSYLNFQFCSAPARQRLRTESIEEALWGPAHQTNHQAADDCCGLSDNVTKSKFALLEHHVNILEASATAPLWDLHSRLSGFKKLHCDDSNDF